MGAPPHRALLRGVRPIRVATIWVLEALYGCWKHPKYKSTRHQSTSPDTGQPGTGVPGTGQPGTGQIYHRSARHWATRHWSTRHQASRHQSSDMRRVSYITGASNQALCSWAVIQWVRVEGECFYFTGHSAVITRHQAPDTRHGAFNHQAPVTRQPVTGHQAPVNLPGTSHQATIDRH